MKKLQLIFLGLLLILSLSSIVSTNAYKSYSISSILIQTKISSSTAPLVEEIELLYPTGYHNLSQVYEELDHFNKSANNLIDFSDIGFSYADNPIPLITLTNEEIPEYTKGKTFIVAHHHAREFCTIEHVLRMIRDFINEYGEDETTNFILDHFIIYIIVTLNPDALDIALYENEWQRKTTRPIDEDGDGLFDEDPPEDVDGDGRISEFATSLRGVGNWTIYLEGYDNDNDSQVNEDRIGGVDLNRNYPFHWNDNTTDSGWGNDTSSYSFPGYNPLSEPESLALTKFVENHNFTQSLSLHSGTNTTLLGWSYTNTPQAEVSTYTNLLYHFQLRNLLPESFFAVENDLDYSTAGGWGDWMYATQHSIPLTLEIYHMAGSELWEFFSNNATHETWSRNTLWEYFNPPAEKLDALHKDLMPFEKYWIGLTPSIEFVEFQNQSVENNEYEIAVVVTTGSEFFNTSDNPRVFVSPSHSDVIRDVPATIPTLLRHKETRVKLHLRKDIPENFFMDVNITSEWASDLYLRIHVSSSQIKSTSGVNHILVIGGIVVITLNANIIRKLRRN